MPGLTVSQKLANYVFFERMFHMLNEGGLWEGDHGRMRKVGSMFVADLETYTYLRKCLPSKYMAQRIQLMEDLTAGGTN